MAEVVEELRVTLERAEAAGIDGERLLVDPGIGFSKSAAHSLEVLRRLPELGALDRPVLSALTKELSHPGRRRPAEGRLMATAAAVAACVWAARTSSACTTSARWWTSSKSVTRYEELRA